MTNKNQNTYKRKNDYNLVYGGLDLLNLMVNNKDYQVSPCLQFTRKEHLIENNIIFYEGIIHEDEIFTYQSIFSAKRAGHIRKSLYHRRYRPNSTMTKEKTFENVYGYFIGYMEMQKILCSTTKLNDEHKQTAEKLILAKQRQIKKLYQNLLPEEKFSIEGLKPDLKELFVKTIK